MLAETLNMTLLSAVSVFLSCMFLIFVLLLLSYSLMTLSVMGGLYAFDIMTQMAKHIRRSC